MQDAAPAALVKVPAAQAADRAPVQRKKKGLEPFFEGRGRGPPSPRIKDVLVQPVAPAPLVDVDEPAAHAVFSARRSEPKPRTVSVAPGKACFADACFLR